MLCENETCIHTYEPLLITTQNKYQFMHSKFKDCFMYYSSIHNDKICFSATLNCFNHQIKLENVHSSYLMQTGGSHRGNIKSSPVD